MGDVDKITILSRSGPESTLQEALAVVAEMLVFERSTLELGGRGWLASLQNLIQWLQRIDVVCLFYFYFVTSGLLWEVYYVLYVSDYEMPSEVAVDPEEPSLGCIQAAT